ncbi:hypothetical protein LJR230_004677 [Trinickia sp. LjRoot230]|uniref:DUF6708 domain-containing protein n=1 Tax=Trinickia sp. LjRoot230 TaxID=3342288 RepID=UPI003ED0950D
MAFDGFSWYRLNRPVSGEELASRLTTDKSWSDSPKDCNTVFLANESCLEICDGNYSEKGWGVIAFLLPGLGSLGATAVIVWMMTHMPPIYEQRGELGLIYSILSFFLLVMFGLSAVGVWALTRDCFNYTRKPVRFSRADRTMYAFRNNGPRGVISVPWDNAFLYVERKPKAGLGRTAPRVVRCLVLNDKGLVVDTFSIGKRVVLAFDESSPAGQQTMEELYRDFEYYRRFMEEGPSSVPPVAKLLSSEVSFRNSLRMQFEDVPDILNSGHPLLWLLLAITALPSLIQATVHYLAQLTCREPVWPDEVEQACNARLPSVEGLAS